MAGGGSVTRARDATGQLGCARSRALALPADAVPEGSPRTRDQPTGDGNSCHSHGSSWDRVQTALLPAAPAPPAARALKWPPGGALTVGLHLYLTCPPPEASPPSFICADLLGFR